MRLDGHPNILSIPTVVLMFFSHLWPAWGLMTKITLCLAARLPSSMNWARMAFLVVSQSPLIRLKCLPEYKGHRCSWGQMRGCRQRQIFPEWQNVGRPEYRWEKVPWWLGSRKLNSEGFWPVSGAKNCQICGAVCQSSPVLISIASYPISRKRGRASNIFSVCMACVVSDFHIGLLLNWGGADLPTSSTDRRAG